MKMLFIFVASFIVWFYKNRFDVISECQKKNQCLLAGNTNYNEWA